MGEIKIIHEMGRFFLIEGLSKVGELDPKAIKLYKVEPMVMGWNIMVDTPAGRRSYGVSRQEDVPRAKEELVKRGWAVVDVREGWVRPGNLD